MALARARLCLVYASSWALPILGLLARHSLVDTHTRQSLARAGYSCGCSWLRYWIKPKATTQITNNE